MFAPQQIVAALEALGITDVVYLPDSTIGQWDAALASSDIRLVRVAREGEAWAIAGGLHLGGRRPIVVIQCTGFFESGDSLRNVLHDWRLPIPSVVGYRSYLNQDTIPGDTCLVFTEPLLDAWRVDWKLFTDPRSITELVDHLRDCADRGVAGCALLAEGKA
jgi:sulfopyruvate decarboxylase TPP-binding subunit